VVTSYIEKLKLYNNQEIERRRAVLKWAQEGKARQVLGTCEYLRDKYGMMDYIHIEGGTIFNTLIIDRLEGLRDEKLALLLNALEHSGADDVSTQEYATSYERDYIYQWYHTDENTGSMLTLHVRIEARFREDSETCRRVLVGYKAPSEPQPIYRIECVEEADAIEPDLSNHTT
jgi:hypothetical protein